MDYFDEFKPIRNKIRQLHLGTALEKLHLLKCRKEVLPEIAEFMYINIVLYAEAPSVSRQHTPIFNSVLQRCIELSGRVYSAKIDSIVWRWLHTMMLNQLKSHYNGYINSTYRYFSIFSDAQLKLHIERCIGFSYVDYLKCSLWLHAVFTRKLKVQKSYFMGKNNGGTSFSAENIIKTLSLLSLPFKALKSGLRSSVTYDDNIFIFHGQTHLEYPIIDDNEYLYCMFPEHLHAQLLSGIYYIAKIYDPEYNLSNPFGKSFERYSGVILSKNNESGKYCISEEIEFRYKGNKLKTSDWIVSSGDEVVFIECKTKRLRLPSKTLVSYSETLDDDIDFIVAAVMQLYKVIHHYVQGDIPGLSFSSHKKIIPIVVTLEEWFAGGPDIKEKLDLAIRSKLEDNQISSDVLEQWPYHSYSIDKFEIDSQMMFHMGFVEFFKNQKNGEIDERFMKSFPFKDYHEAEFAETFLKP